MTAKTTAQAYLDAQEAYMKLVLSIGIKDPTPSQLKNIESLRQKCADLRRELDGKNGR